MKSSTVSIIANLAITFVLLFVGFFSVGYWAAFTNHDHIARFCLFAFPISLVGVLIFSFIVAMESGKAIGKAVAYIVVDKALDKVFKK